MSPALCLCPMWFWHFHCRRRLALLAAPLTMLLSHNLSRPRHSWHVSSLLPSLPWYIQCSSDVFPSLLHSSDTFTWSKMAPDEFNWSLGREDPWLWSQNDKHICDRPELIRAVNIFFNLVKSGQNVLFQFSQGPVSHVTLLCCETFHLLYLLITNYLANSCIVLL